jgi:antitoxin component of MazEF toxin-antitoxin module
MYTGRKHFNTLGEEVNIPAKLLEAAGLELGVKLSVLISGKTLILATTEEDYQRDLTDELSCLMEEIGLDPDYIYSFTDSDEDEEYCDDANDDEGDGYDE